MATRIRKVARKTKKPDTRYVSAGPGAEAIARGEGMPIENTGRGRPGPGLVKDTRSGLYREITAGERLKRMQLAEHMIAAATPTEAMYDLFADQFGMTRTATGQLINKVLDQWIQDEEDQRPHYKRAAIRRIHGHIAQAKQAGKWSAVAQFEGHLARIQGTFEPLEININLEANVRTAVLAVISDATPERLQQLAERALAYRDPHGQCPAIKLLESQQEPANRLPAHTPAAGAADGAE